jgi:hypothetical protein
MKNLILPVFMMAAICCATLAGGGEGEGPEQKAAPEPPVINVIIEEEPTDHWGLAIKYGLPVLGTVALGIVAIMWGKKRKKKGKDDDGEKPKLEDV